MELDESMEVKVEEVDKGRITQFKNRGKPEEMRLRRAECTVELRKKKLDETLWRRRNLEEVEDAKGAEPQEETMMTHDAIALECEQVLVILASTQGEDLPAQKRDAFLRVRNLFDSCGRAAATRKIVVEQVTSSGLIPALVKGLDIKDEEIQNTCAWVLDCIIASGAASNDTIEGIAESARDTLIKLMMSKSLDVAESALTAVADLAQHSARLRKSVLRSGWLWPALMDLCYKMERMSVSLLRTLAWTFHFMIRGDLKRLHYQDYEALLQQLIDLMKNEDPEVRTHACFALRDLTGIPDARDYFPLSRPRAVEVSVVFALLTDEDDVVAAASLRALSNMTMGQLDVGDCSLAQSVIDLGALEVTKEVVSKAKSPAIVADALQLISNIIGGSRQHIQYVIDCPGMLSMLLSILKEGNYTCQCHCVWALQLLVVRGTLAQNCEVLEAKPWAALAASLAHSNTDMLTTALELVMFLLAAAAKGPLEQFQAIKQEVEEVGMLDRLEHLQDHESTTVSDLAHIILAKYLSDEEQEEDHQGEHDPAPFSF